MQPENPMLSTEAYLEIVESFIGIMSQDGRSRLANNLRRYFAPTTSLRVIENGQVDKLASERKIAYPVSVLFIDIRDFVKTIRSLQEHPTGMQRSRDLLQRFFEITINIVFSYEGAIGEFAGDRIMAVFGVPDEQHDHAHRAVQAAIEIERAIDLRINSRGMAVQSALNVGIGIHSDNELYLGDVGSSWRRELVIIGSMVNIASRIEDLTKSDAAKAVHGHNILVSQGTRDLLGDDYEFQTIGMHKIRGYHDVGHPDDQESMEVYKVVRLLGSGKSSPVSQSNTVRDVVSHIAEYIESYEERKRSLEYRATIESISLLWASSDSIDNTLAEVLRVTCEMLGASNATLWLVEDLNGEEMLVPTVVVPPGTDVLPKKPSEGLIGKVARDGRPMLVVDLLKQDQGVHRPDDDARARFQLRSMLAVPIIANNRVIGAIQLLDSAPGRFRLSDEQTLSSIAAETSLLLQKRTIEKDKLAIEAYAQQLGVFKTLNTKLLEHVRQSLMTQVNPDALLTEIMEGVVSTFGARYATLYLIDWAQKELEFRVVIPQRSAENLPKRHPFGNGGIAVHVAQTGESILVQDLLSGTSADGSAVKRSRDYDDATRFQPRSMMCVPIESQGKVSAVLQVMDNERDKFHDIDLEVLQYIASTAGIALENVLQYRRRTRAEQIAAMNLMAGNMVHHFNNEVGLIPPTLEYLQHKIGDWDLPPERSAFLTRNFEKLKVSARNALNYVKIIREPFENHPQPIKVLDAIQAGVERAKIPDDVTLDIEIEENTPLVVASPELSIVFRDLLKNAVEAMVSSQTEDKRIQIRTILNVDTVQIVVCDSGPGIPEEKKDELFQSYGTVSTKGEANMGFGLFLANFYVEVMGGRLFLDSKQDTGACLVVELQIAEDVEP